MNINNAMDLYIYLVFGGLFYMIVMFIWVLGIIKKECKR